MTLFVLCILAAFSLERNKICLVEKWLSEVELFLFLNLNHIENIPFKNKKCADFKHKCTMNFQPENYDEKIKQRTQQANFDRKL